MKSTPTASTEHASGRFVDDYLAALLAQASQLISSEFHLVVRKYGFSVSEWRVMASLANGKPISIGQLAHDTVNKQPTLTRLLDRMESKGQVERLPHESDRRVTLVRITEAGMQTVDHLITLAREHEQRVLAPFGLSRAEQLKQTLRQIIDLHATLQTSREPGAQPKPSRGATKFQEPVKRAPSQPISSRRSPVHGTSQRA